MLLVQKYLETHTLSELAAEHGVYASFSKSGHKFSLNYDQIEAKEDDPLAQECRGLILSLEDGLPVIATGTTQYATRDATVIGKTKILAFPMKRFFNHGQGAAANVNWSDPNLAVLQKLDGTLCIVYHDPWTAKWCVATRSVPEADLLMDNGIFTFRALFEKAAQDTCQMDFEHFTMLLDPFYTYCFELTTPYNRIVVDYKNNGITLLAVRGLITQQELRFDHPLIEEKMGGVIPLVQAHTYTSMPDLLDWVSSLNPMEHEGVVVRDSNFNRIKVKNAAYVAYNKVRDCLATSERNCVELILAEKDDDVIPMLPEEIVKNLNNIKAGLQKAIHEHDLVYDMVKSFVDVAHPGSKKEFALAIQKAVQHGKSINRVIWSAPLFQIFDGKAKNMKDFIMLNRKDGTWSNSFLDKILSISKNIST